jgi:hypothetical protein
LLCYIFLEFFVVGLFSFHARLYISPSTFVFALQHGNFPIMLAAGHEHRELVEILFLQTKPIPLFPDWSVDGIIRAMKYLSFEPQVC